MAVSNRKFKCWKCQGKGLIPPKMRDKHIKGAGAIHYTQEEWVDCDTCGGTGNI